MIKNELKDDINLKTKFAFKKKKKYLIVTLIENLNNK